MGLLFESQTCTRCHGCGEYSYCQRFGSVCFKCNGKGVCLTKRGQVAQSFYRESLCIEAAEIKLGDKILDENRWHTVEEITTENLACKTDGVERVYKYISFKCKNFISNASENSQIRICHTVADKKEKIKLALDFQATLTKQGKPRKIRGKK